MPIRDRQPAPTVIQDSLPLPPKLPDLPADVMERFPSLRSWQTDTTAWYRKLAGAIQDGNRSISQTTTQVKKTTDLLGVELIERFEELEDEVGNLFGKYTLAVVAGDVVTGMVLTSATGDTPISDVTFQASSFKIYNNVTGISMFDVSGSDVRLAGTLVVSTSGKVYIGTGTWGNSNTSFYVDDAGQFSLKDKLTWDGTTLAINGVITSASGTIGGFTIGATTLSAGSGASRISLSNTGTNGILLGNPPAVIIQTNVSGHGLLEIRSSSGSQSVTISGASGDVTLSGSGGLYIEDGVLSFGLSGSTSFYSVSGEISTESPINLPMFFSVAHQAEFSRQMVHSR
jgi:hypothetical protein